MKTTNKKLIIVSLLSVASIATIGSTLAFNSKSIGRVQLDDATRTAIQESMTNNDYEAFQNITKDLENHPRISQERFEQIAQRASKRGFNKEDRLTSKEDRIKIIQERMEKMQNIINDLDYDARKEITPDQMLKTITTEDKFLKLAEAHEYMQKAREIREELGIEKFHTQNMENGNMMNGNMNRKYINNNDMMNPMSGNMRDHRWFGRE